MKTEELKELQAPLKAKYRDTPDAAVITLKADGKLGEGITCSVQTGKALTAAGLHPATGGDGSLACSGDMLLEALVACAGVTLRAVATAIGVQLRDARITAEGDLDFRGTLGVSKEQSSSPEPPVAGCKPATASARPVSTLQAMWVSSSVPLAFKVM